MNGDATVVDPDTLPALAVDPDAPTATAMIDNLAQLLDAAFEAQTHTRQLARANRDALYHLTLSSIATCRRQAAYRTAATPPSNPERAYTGQNRTAHVGTWIHEGILPTLAELTGGNHELQLTLTAAGLTITGHTDLYWPRAGLLADLKTIDDDPTRGGGPLHPAPRHWYQLAAYATAAAQHGHLVRWMAWIYLDRGTGNTWSIVQPYTPDVATEIDTRITTIALDSANPDHAPREQPGPGRSLVCDSCPWVTRCWR